MKRLRENKFVKCGIIAAIILIILEGICWLFPAADLKRNHLSTYQDAGSLFKEVRVAHPYFGQVFSTSQLGVNNMGFATPQNFPYVKEKDEYVIGLVGGTIAYEFAKDVSKEFVEYLKENNPYLRNKKVTLINFALPAQKQPQQFFIASYHHEMLDMVINLEGFNEFGTGFSNGFPRDFPDDMHYYMVDSKERALTITKASFLSKIDQTLTSLAINIPGLSYSQLFYFVWRHINEMIEKRIGELKNSIQAVVDPERNKEYEFKEPRAEFLERFDIWKKYTINQARILQINGVESYFFLQPNQYVENSKKMTEEEMKLAWRPKSHPEVPLWFARLKEEIPYLREMQVNYQDLTGIYKNVDETIYKDHCCMVNHKGNLIMAREMASRIKVRPKMGSSPLN